MPLLDHFGILAPFYDRLIPDRTSEKLIELVGLPVRGPLLDAGGGTGRVAKALLGLADRVVVADLSIKMLRQAAGKGDLLRAASHTECLPFPDKTFERIVMVDALHHVCSHVETATEMWRVLKPGGRIVIVEPDVSTLAVKFVALAEKVALMRSHFLAPQRIEALFPYPNAVKSVERDRFNAWVSIDKAPGG